MTQIHAQKEQSMLQALKLAENSLQSKEKQIQYMQQESKFQNELLIEQNHLNSFRRSSDQISSDLSPRKRQKSLDNMQQYASNQEKSFEKRKIKFEQEISYKNDIIQELEVKLDQERSMIQEKDQQINEQKFRLAQQQKEIIKLTELLKEKVIIKFFNFKENQYNSVRVTYQQKLIDLQDQINCQAIAKKIQSQFDCSEQKYSTQLSLKPYESNHSLCNLQELKSQDLEQQYQKAQIKIIELEQLLQDKQKMLSSIQEQTYASLCDFSEMKQLSSLQRTHMSGDLTSMECLRLKTCLKQFSQQKKQLELKLYKSFDIKLNQNQPIYYQKAKIQID